MSDNYTEGGFAVGPSRHLLAIQGEHATSMSLESSVLGVRFPINGSGEGNLEHGKGWALGARQMLHRDKGRFKTWP